MHWADQGGRQLSLHLLGRQLLEKASFEVASVVDEDIDATKPVGRRLYCSLGVCSTRDVKLDRK